MELMKMNWIDTILVTLLAHLYLLINITPTYASSKDLFSEDPYADGSNTSSDSANIEDYIQLLSSVLMKPWPSGLSPLVYIEKEFDQILRNEDAQMYSESSNLSEDKRSKYYRKFPLKRQNKYLRYDAENRYMCLPSKEEVFKLFVALHETQQGKRGKTVSFCNRKRPARAVFTNIRFLGK
ncbi:uncharacterized protein LOC123311205 [Coccinella septempunctata]|uniref:uncharacterized protein LOC123311205 n=1 Tax=Coccinella septempunctata TaxID=41139 RepID=UPI001D062D41|nr:uncharacterized protein LOC123311205 [Coccinella septempunctata]XP_044750967.1 uncharacterized protein LOC123311205 [Coccinella septempunctata]